MSVLGSTAWAVIFALGIYCLRIYMGGPDCESTARIDGKVVLITGPNTGIGKETALDLVRRGGKVYMGCRSLDRCKEAAHDIVTETGDSSRVKILKLDLSSLRSIREAVEEFKKQESQLHILINNAGVFWMDGKTEDGFQYTFGVNHLGHFYLTALLTDILKASAPSRIVTLSSDGHRFGEINFDVIQAENVTNTFFDYTNSKLANILHMRELAKRLKGTGVTTYSVQPGAVQTDMGRNSVILNAPVIKHFLMALTWPLMKDTRQGAQTSICCAVDEKLALESGKYYSDCKETEPAAHAQDDVMAKKLWDYSEKVLNITSR